MTGDGPARSVAYLASSLAALPEAMREAQRVAPPARPRRVSRVVTTGIGASEGPARCLAGALVDRGVAARFVPLSLVAGSDVEADLLVAFSQGASPNACHALGAEHRFDRRWLVTSVDPEGDGPESRRVRTLRGRGVETVRLPPRRESGALVRVVGPTVATLAALGLASHLSGDDSLAAELAGAPLRFARVAAREAAALPDETPCAVVTAGRAPDDAIGVAWAYMEALLRPLPPVWDVLAFAHGPRQVHADARLHLLVLETPRGAPFLARLATSLAPGHTLQRLVAEDDGPLAALDHAAAFHATLLATLRATPQDLFTWPLRGEECALYRLGDEEP